MARLVRRGEVWITDLNPGYGTEIHKKRPTLIISIDKLNQNYSKVITIPLSSQIYPLGPEKVLITKESLRLNKDSVILAAEIRTIDKSRLVKRIGKLSQEKLSEVEEAIKLVLGMEIFP